MHKCTLVTRRRCGSLTASELNLDRNQIAVIPAALAQAGRLKVR